MIAIVLPSPDPDDLPFLLDHLQPIAGHWKAFGLLIPGGPAAYLQEVLTKWMNHAPPFPTLTKLCDALRSHTVDHSRTALELEQQYQSMGIYSMYSG